MTLLCIAGIFLPELRAVPPDGAERPFGAIAQRNLFGLRPAPLPPPEVRPAPAPPKVYLTGIAAGLGMKKRALLETTLPVRPPAQPKKSYFTLGEGEREGELEVLSIDEIGGCVEIRVLGVAMRLTLANDGLKPSPAAPAVAVMPALQPRPVPPPQTPQPQLQLGRDEAALVMEAERLRLKQGGNPLANLMPVTHLTPDEAQSASLPLEAVPASVPVMSTPRDRPAASR